MILAIFAVAILGVTISNEVTDEKHDLFVSDGETLREKPTAHISIAKNKNIERLFQGNRVLYRLRIKFSDVRI